MDKELVRKSMEKAVHEEFEERVRDQAEFLRGELEAGHLDNPDYTIGLEIEVYGVDDDYRITDIPDSIYRGNITKELGMHNAEINTSPESLSQEGLENKKTQVNDALDSIQEDFTDIQLVMDSIWTIPPEEGSIEYLSHVYRDEDLSLAANMRDLPRYAAIDNYIMHLKEDYSLNLPGFTGAFPTLLFESLATSIQPHLQIPNTDDFPDYFNTAVRTTGPVLALCTNSPFLPYDMYDENMEIHDLDKTYHELRIPIFDQAVNAYREYDRKKLKFPRDIEETSDFLDRVVEDLSYSPFLEEWLNSNLELEDQELRLDENEIDLVDEGDVADYIGSFWEFDHKRTTYWRWVRPVIGVNTDDSGEKRGSIRIEYRPIPTQPAVEDVVSVQALVSGLLIGLVEEEHPLLDLEWRKSKISFYNAVEDGIDGQLYWVDEDGEVTTDNDVMYEEIFRYARKGLESQEIDPGYAKEVLEPMKARWKNEMTPSKWKIEKVRDGMRSGESFPDAVADMQADYIRNSNEEESFADWF
ncbi:MAG: hypothetical protein ABEK59_11295 [Halobacteria archaeon]